MWLFRRLHVYCGKKQRMQYQEWFDGICEVRFSDLSCLFHESTSPWELHCSQSDPAPLSLGERCIEEGTNDERNESIQRPDSPESSATIIDLSESQGWLSLLKKTGALIRDDLNKTMLVLETDKFEEVIEAADLGYFDVLLKPVGRSEVLYRTYRMLHQGYCRQNRFNLLLNSIKREARRTPYPAVNLTPVEFSILQCLSQSAAGVVKRREIVYQIWGGVKISSKTLDVHISNLRKKIQPLNLSVNWLENDCYCLAESIASFREIESLKSKYSVEKAK